MRDTVATPFSADIRQSSLLRSPVARVFDYRDTVSFLHGNGALRFAGDHARVARLIMELLDEPRGRAAVLEAARAEVPSRTDELIDEVLVRLVAVRAIVTVGNDENGPPARRASEESRATKLCLAVSGAIGCLHAPLLIQALQETRFSVRVVMTKSATRFLRRRGLEALTHNRVLSSLWERDGETPVPHINLAKWADVVLLWPATATTIARVASGSFDDLVSAIALASRKPVIVAPSMNREMYLAPSVRRNIAKLRSDGFYVLHPGLGYELADRPEDRVPVFGVSPPIGVICDLVSFISKQGTGPERERATALA